MLKRTRVYQDSYCFLPHYCLHCGKEIKLDKKRRFWYETHGYPIFIRNHHAGYVSSKYQVIYGDFCYLPIRCQCPCNEIIPLSKGQITTYERYGYPKYIRGHHQRVNPTSGMNGHHQSEHHKQVITKRMIGNQYMKGKHRSEDSKVKQSESIKGCKNHRYGKPSAKGAGCGHGSYYQSPSQGKIYLRSTWEVACAKYFDEHNILWFYEFETFDLGDTTYTPDFYLPKEEKFIEVKGYLMHKYENKMKKFQQEYPWDLEIWRKDDLKRLGII